MRRREFLSLAGAVPLLAAAPAAEVEIPAELRGGRLFAVPATVDGRTFACWLDTNGAGFIFDWAVSDFGIATRTTGDSQLAKLPAFAAGRGVPSPLRDGGELAVFHESGGDRRNPVFAGFAAQLGGSWFADRVWHLDFRGGHVTMGGAGLQPSPTTMSLGFDRVYPQLSVRIAGSTMLMALDIAASVPYRPEYRNGGDFVQATSFVSRGMFDAWRARFPDWRVELGVSTVGGVDRITVPEVHLGATVVRDVGFTTRPDDDVFQNAPVQGKLGANAYSDRIVAIDYPNGRLQLL